MLGGICPEVVDLLKDKSLNPTTFDVLRKMKPMRQIEAADLMSTAGNYTASYAKALLAATRQADLVKSEQPKKVGGLTPDQMARMEREMETVQQDLKMVEARYGDDVLHLVIASGYLSKLVGQFWNQTLPDTTRGDGCARLRHSMRSAVATISSIELFAAGTGVSRGSTR